MPTLWVDADAAGASDAGDYTALQDSSTPAKTIAHAANLAVVGDVINVRPAVAANTSDPNGQTDVYVGLVDDTFGGAWSAVNKDASTARITLQAVPGGGGQAPKLNQMAVRNLKNWKVDGFQIGYDLGSGFDADTAMSLIGLTDTLFSNILFTGGGANILGFHGHCQWVGCELVSKLFGGGSFMEGAGFRVLCRYNADETAGPDDWMEFLGLTAHHVQGEDAVQMLGSPGVGNCLIEDSSFDYMLQTEGGDTAHTDAIQTTGLQALIVRRSTFGTNGAVASQIIASDSTSFSTLDTLVLENNLFVGSPQSGFSTQFGGINNITIRHNTWARSNFAGLRFYQHAIPPETVEIVNNVIDRYQVDNGLAWDETKQHHNVIGSGPATSGDYSVVPEFGTSDDTVFELANSPVNAAGVDQGVTSDITTDRLGRSRKGSAPDCGCHESDPDVPVTVAPRPPILVSTTPGSGATGVAAGTSIRHVFYPKPGEELDPETVTPETVIMRDAAGLTIPTVLTLEEIGENGQQAIEANPVQVLDPLTEGDLFPLVNYTVTVTDDLADTEGSAYGGNEMSFRVAGTGQPAIGEPTVGPGTVSFTMAPDPRFKVGQTVYLFRGAGLVPISPIPVTSAVVAADSTTTFTGLDSGAPYLAGFTASGPFIGFRT